MRRIDDVRTRALAHLERFLDERHRGWEHNPRVVDAATALSVAYTQTRAIDVDAASSAAYLAHFGPRAIIAVCRAMRVCGRPGHVVIDVGAGSGASSLPWLIAGASRIHLVERSAHALLEAGRLLSGTSTRVTSERAHVEDARPLDDADTLAAAFVFGELPTAPRDAYASMARLAPRARTTLLVDAGDHARARRIQELRDALVVDGASIAGPCGHRDPCPALLRARDWCHDRVDKELPPRLAAFSRAVGRDDEAMSLSWLVVGEEPSQHESLVVIGEAQREKGRVRLPVCGPRGLRYVQALKRHRDAFDSLERLPRGAQLSTSVARDLRGDTAHVDGPIEADAHGGIDGAVVGRA